MDSKNSFILYTEIADVIKELTNEQKGILFQAILDYQIGKEVVIDEPIVRVAFTPIKQNLDRNAEKWERIRLKRSEAGKKGMSNRWKDNNPITNDNKAITNDNKGITKITVNVNDNVNANVNDNVNVNGNVNVNEKEEIKKNTKKKNSSLIIYREIKKEYPTSEPMDKTLEQWFGYRDEIKKPLSEKSIRQLIDKVNGLEGQYGFSSVKSCFTESMTNGYQGVFFDKLGKVTPIRDNKKAVDDFFRRELGL